MYYQAIVNDLSKCSPIQLKNYIKLLELGFLKEVKTNNGLVIPPSEYPLLVSLCYKALNK